MGPTGHLSSPVRGVVSGTGPGLGQHNTKRCRPRQKPLNDSRVRPRLSKDTGVIVRWVRTESRPRVLLQTIHLLTPLLTYYLLNT